MSDIKTVILDGGELKVEGMNGQNTEIINKSSGAVYASKYPGIVPEADGVIEIAAGSRDGLHGTNGTLYLLGTGKVELRGTDYSVNFRQPSSSTSDGGGTPTAETMPVMYGITGYFTPETLDIENGLWRSAVKNAPDISLTNAESAGSGLHFPADGFGELQSDVPRTIYAILKTSRPHSGGYGSLISKGFMGSISLDGTGFDIDSAADNIYLDGLNTAAPVVLGTDYDNYHLYAATYENATTVVGYCDGVKMGSNSTFVSDARGYTGIVYLNSQNINGNRYSTPYPSDFLMLAFGTAKHTGEQIKINSEWLMKKYPGGG